MKFEINLGGLWTMLVGTATAIVWMFTNFVSIGDFESYIIEDFYDRYYEYEDDLIEADDPDEVRRLERDMARLKSKICNIEPEWQECNPVITD